MIISTYDDTSRHLEKDRETLKWGEVYDMSKKYNFSIEDEDPYEIQVFKNTMKLGIFRKETHPIVFPYVYSITWILNNIDVNGRYICNPRK
jgi:hypothetical protein